MQAQNARCAYLEHAARPLADKSGGFSSAGGDCSYGMFASIQRVVRVTQSNDRHATAQAALRDALDCPASTSSPTPTLTSLLDPSIRRKRSRGDHQHRRWSHIARDARSRGRRRAGFSFACFRLIERSALGPSGRIGSRGLRIDRFGVKDWAATKAAITRVKAQSMLFMPKPPLRRGSNTLP